MTSPAWTQRWNDNDLVAIIYCISIGRLGKSSFTCWEGLKLYCEEVQGNNRKAEEI